MKRLTAILLALVMLFAMTCTASAEEAVTITVGSVKGEIGDVIEVPVTVSDDHYMVNGRIFLTYDPTVLELQQVCEDGDTPYFETVNPDILDSSFMWAFSTPAAGKANFVFATSSATGNRAGGAIYTLTFKLLKETGNSTIVVTVPEIKTNSTGGDDTAAVLTLVDGTVRVTEVDNTPAMRGDTNGDGNVNLADATRLFYFINGLAELTDQQLLNADLTGDGSVDLNDASHLFYFVAGIGEL